MVLESSLYKSENTLLETVCKCILDEAGETYGDDDFPKLYKIPAKVLVLSIPPHTEQPFKSILGGTQSII